MIQKWGRVTDDPPTPMVARGRGGERHQAVRLDNDTVLAEIAVEIHRHRFVKGDRFAVKSRKALCLESILAACRLREKPL